MSELASMPLRAELSESLDCSRRGWALFSQGTGVALVDGIQDSTRGLILQ